MRQEDDDAVRGPSPGEPRGPAGDAPAARAETAGEPGPAHAAAATETAPAAACPPDWCRRPEVRAYREAVCAEQGWSADHHVLVDGPDGAPCWCTCVGCGEWCTSPEGLLAVDRACQQAGLPPGWPVRVQRPDGTWCTCTCGLG